MLAIIKVGGKQYKVKENEIIKVEKIKGDKDSIMELNDVLLIADEEGENVKIGTPFIEGAMVKTQVMEQGRDAKVNVIKYKRKVRYRRKSGHRQPFTKLKVLDIKF